MAKRFSIQPESSVDMAYEKTGYHCIIVQSSTKSHKQDSLLFSVVVYLSSNMQFYHSRRARTKKNS